MSERRVVLRESFRPVIAIQKINEEQYREEGYRYKNVIITYKYDLNKVQRYLQRGWEIVQTTSPSQDDRSFVPKSKEEKLRPQMRVETTTDGHEQILMRILWTKDVENKLEDKRVREYNQLRESQRRGDKVTKRGNEVITKGSELTDQSRESSADDF